MATAQEAKNLAIIALVKGKDALYTSNGVSVNEILTQLDEQLTELNDVQLPQLETNLTILNSTTIPQLESDLATIENRTDVLAAGTILANIANAGTVNALHLNASNIWANSTWTNAIIANDGWFDTLTANKVWAGELAANILVGKEIYVDDNNPIQSGAGEITSSRAIFRTSTAWVGALGYNTSSSGAGIGGVGKWGVDGYSSQASGVGVRGLSAGSGGTGVWGEDSSYSGRGVHGKGRYGVSGEGSLFGLYTTDQCYFEGSAYPFTGSHFCFVTQQYEIGDILSAETAYLHGISQMLPFCYLSNTIRDKKIFGVVCDTNGSVLDYAKESGVFGENEYDTDGNIIGRKIKDEYYDLVMLYSTYQIGKVNAIGEGGVNVCNANGDIDVGDYICSSNVAGKGMKQDDDLLHSYTVAKALEAVVWADEANTTKMIACVYCCA